MKKVLYITARYPFPLITGDALRAYNQIKSISENSVVDVFSIEPISSTHGDLNSFCNEIYIHNISSFKKLVNIARGFYNKPLQSAMYHDNQVWRKLRDLIITKKYDIIFFQLIRLEWLITKSIKLKNNNGLKTKIYCDYVDALSLNMKNRANSEKGIKKLIINRESKKILIHEKKVFPLLDRKIIISHRDADFINVGKFDVVPNGVTLPSVTTPRPYVQCTAHQKTINIVFFGNMSYYPNVAAALLLVDIFKSLSESKYQLNIIGAKPVKKILALNGVHGVKVYGYVDDLNNLLSQMDLAVFPILNGSGLQNKVLEAFALQIPVITTSIVMQSIIHSRQCSIIANSKEEFVEAIEKFSMNGFPIKEITENARDLISQEYNWNKINYLI